ncbi:hypothetical protein SNEBB_010032 [Seison nebaliae]|nr:hypothetical protein SNEBB_010032 [Seison nebaliae]
MKEMTKETETNRIVSREKVSIADEIWNFTKMYIKEWIEERLEKSCDVEMKKYIGPIIAVTKGIAYKTYEMIAQLLEKESEIMKIAKLNEAKKKYFQLSNKEKIMKIAQLEIENSFYEDKLKILEENFKDELELYSFVTNKKLD